MLRLLRHACAGAVLACVSSAASAALPAPLDRVLRAYRLPESGVSVMIQAVDGSPGILAQNGDVPRNPASAIKLLTTFVALDLLGPTHTWPTGVYTLGPVRDRVLEGDLLLKGYGDPFLVEEQFWKMLGELRRRGVQHIKGDLVIDDSHFAVAETDPGAFDGQPFRLYNVLPNAFMVNFKALTFYFTPRADGAGVAIRTEPELPNLTIVNQLKLVKDSCRGLLATASMNVPDPVAADRVVFSGTYATGCGEQYLPRTAMQPATYAFGMFQRLWTQWGGTLSGTVKRGLRPAGKRPLFVWRSPPLAEIIRPLNKWSNNVMANAFLYTLGDIEFAPPITAQHGAAVIRNYLLTRKLSADGLEIDNGAGLSRKTRITARGMLDLLLYAYRSPYMPEYISSLSIAGVDGTMHRRFKRRPETGRMHVKTGHLNDVAAVAGYVLAQSGKTYAVALFVNDPSVNRGAGSDLINAVLSWTYRH